MLRPPKSVTTYLNNGTPNQEERESIGCNHISRFVGFPNPSPNGLNPVQTTKAGQLAIHVKQTPEKLAKTKN
jgi:hypothetical protein